MHYNDDTCPPFYYYRTLNEVYRAQIENETRDQAASEI